MFDIISETKQGVFWGNPLFLINHLIAKGLNIMTIKSFTTFNSKNQDYVPSEICSVKGCDREVGVKKAGLCQKHYDQQRQSGKLTTFLRTDPNEIIIKKNICIIVLRDIKNKRVAETLIDAKDLNKVKGYKWHYSKGYATCKKIGFMHRLIMPNVLLVDHRNRDSLDNRRSNLREASLSTNAANSKLRSNSTSGFKGVSFFKKTGTWRSYICVNQRFISLGYYQTPEEAAYRYDVAAVKYFGEYAATNKNLGLI